MEETNRPSTSTNQTLPVAKLRRSTFTFDYNKLPDKILHCLKKNKPLNNRQIDKVVQCVVDSVTFSVAGVERGFFGPLSEDIIEDYPKSFEEISVGSKTRNLTNSKEKLCYKLKNRFDNGNRGEKTDMQKEAPNRPEAYGCVRWRVLSFPPGSTEEELKQIAEEMRIYFNTQKKNAYDWEEIKLKMTKTYGLQRAIIISQINYTNKSKRKEQQKKQTEENNEEDGDGEEEIVTTSSINEEFPMLFTYVGMIHHFEMLTGKDFEKLLSDWLTSVEDILVDFLALGKPDNLKLKAQLKKIKKRDPSNEESELIAIFLMLANYFKDDINLLVQCVDVSYLLS